MRSDRPARRLYDGPDHPKPMSAQRPRELHLEQEITWRLRSQRQERPAPEEPHFELPERA